MRPRDGILPCRAVSRFLFISLLLGAACATAPVDGYVPGGAGLDRDARERYRSIVQLERAGKREQALEKLSRLCRDHPIRLGLHLHRLRLARELRGADYAASLYDPPPQGVDPERAGILADLARVPRDEPAEAKTILEFATTREPKQPFWQLCLADLGLTAHDLVVERARQERLLGQVQAETRSLAEASQVLGRAREAAERTIALDPGLAEGYLMLAYIDTRAADMVTDADERDERRKAALEQYRNALKLDPQSLTARIDLAETYLFFDEYTEAAQQLEIAARLAPRDSRIWNNLGYTYNAVGQLDDAVSSYERALRFDPADVRARVALADCERRRGDTKKSVSQLLRARDEAGDDAEIRALIAFKLAAIHEFNGRYRDAIQEYERYIELGGVESAKARSRVRYIYEHAFE